MCFSFSSSELHVDALVGGKDLCVSGSEGRQQQNCDIAYYCYISVSLSVSLSLFLCLSVSIFFLFLSLSVHVGRVYEIPVYGYVYARPRCSISPKSHIPYPEISSTCVHMFSCECSQFHKNLSCWNLNGGNYSDIIVSVAKFSLWVKSLNCVYLCIDP